VKTDYREPVNLFTVVILPPANRKSSVFRDVTGPITDWERAESLRMAPEIADSKHHRKMAEALLERATKDAVKAEGEEREIYQQEASRLARELAEMRDRVSPRLIANDVTTERLGILLQDHGGRMAVMAPEGAIFSLMAGRYAKDGKPNFEIINQGHAGDTIVVDRTTRPPVHVPNPALTLGLAVQPDVIIGLVQNPAFRTRIARPLSVFATRQPRRPPQRSPSGHARGGPQRIPGQDGRAPESARPRRERHAGDPCP
jgi:hypothetical protein